MLNAPNRTGTSPFQSLFGIRLKMCSCECQLDKDKEQVKWPPSSDSFRTRFVTATHAAGSLERKKIYSGINTEHKCVCGCERESESATNDMQLHTKSAMLMVKNAECLCKEQLGSVCRNGLIHRKEQS